MSGLANQEQKESYSYDEVQHLIAREWAKNEIVSLRNGALESQRQLIEITGSFNNEMKNFREMLTNFPENIAEQISRCRIEIRREIDKDFPNKIEAIHMEQRIENKIGDTDETLGKQISALDKKVDGIEVKVDKQWAKITVIVSTIVAIGGVVQWFLSVKGGV